MNKDKILYVLIYIVTILTIIITLFFQKDLTKVVWTISIGSTIAGFLTILKKNNYGYLIFSVGFSLLLTISLYTLNLLDKGDSVTFMICSSIFLLMLITFIISIINNNKIKQIYSKEIEATVSDLIKNPNTNKEYYQVIYEYVIDDNLYTVGSPDYINNFIPNIGDKRKLRVNSKDFTDVFFDKRIIDQIYEKGLVISLIIISLIIIITLFI